MRHLGFASVVLSGCIVACGSDSTLDPPSASTSQNASLNAPGSLRASPVSPTEVDLAWQPSSTQENGFQVYRSTTGASGAYTLLASLAATARSYADVGLAGSTEYCYEVRSWRTTGKITTYSSYAGPMCAMTPAPPPPPIASPSGVSAVPVRDDYEAPYNSGVQVNWADNSTNEDGFRIDQASSAAGPWTHVTTSPANSTSVHWYGVREQQVCFRVTAVNSSSASNPSAAACTTPPANPTNLAARPTDHGIDLAWSDNSAVEDGYRVSRADASGIWTDVAALPANATSYVDEAVFANVTYIYRIQALKDGGSSNYSNQAVGVIPTDRPATPLDAAATYWADNEYGWLHFDAWWTDASTNEEGFRLESSSDGVSGWMTLAATPANAPYFSAKYDLFLFATAPFSVCHRVIAFNAAGDSDPSNVVCTGWGEAPGNLVATTVDQQSIDLSWTDTARFEKGYLVLRSTSLDGMWEVAGAVAANATNHRDTGLASGQEYWYIVSVEYDQYSVYDPFNYSYASATTLSP